MRDIDVISFVFRFRDLDLYKKFSISAKSKGVKFSARVSKTDTDIKTTDTDINFSKYPGYTDIRDGYPDFIYY